jgi:hypothetical protein
MSHNPNTIESQSELNTCNDGKRSSDVLVETISKLETTTKQLEIAKKALDVYAYQTIKETETDEDGEEYDIEYPYSNDDGEVAKTALKQIEELNK